MLLIFFSFFFFNLFINQHHKIMRKRSGSLTILVAYVKRLARICSSRLFSLLIMYIINFIPFFQQLASLNHQILMVGGFFYFFYLKKRQLCNSIFVMNFLKIFIILNYIIFIILNFILIIKIPIRCPLPKFLDYNIFFFFSYNENL